MLSKMKILNYLYNCLPGKCIKCGAKRKNCELVNGLCSNCR